VSDGEERERIDVWRFRGFQFLNGGLSEGIAHNGPLGYW